MLTQKESNKAFPEVLQEFCYLQSIRTLGAVNVMLDSESQETNSPSS